MNYKIDNSSNPIVLRDDFSVSYEKYGKTITSISEPGNYTAVLTFIENYSIKNRIDFNVSELSILFSVLIFCFIFKKCIFNKNKIINIYHIIRGEQNEEKETL